MRSNLRGQEHRILGVSQCSKERLSLPLVLGKSLRDQSVFVTGGWERGGGGGRKGFLGGKRGGGGGGGGVVGGGGGGGGGGGESVLAILSIKGDYRKLTANTEPYGRIR